MPRFDDISMNLRVDGVNIPEFMAEEDLEKRRITCWVPSQVGKEFQVIADSRNRGRGSWKADVSADGKLARSIGFTKDIEQNIGFCGESTTTARPFMFNKVELVDDDALLHSPHASRIGEIEVACHVIEIVIPGYKNPNYRMSFDGNKKVHERAKKGIAEHIGLGKVVQTSPCTFMKVRTKEHIVTFVFRYRSLAYLQAQGIAPRGPQIEIARDEDGHSSHAKNASDYPPGLKREESEPKIKEEALEESDDENDEEIRVLEAKLEEARARKRKQKGDIRSVSKKVKREEIARFVSGEVIDLT
ncbi:hypothetical protein P691DRAFT_777780 [Macrolepiota fuliginosa MF-IS2]|uniref:DUF7918 domain-containing protein n=1 Tax=Macrolepiota fuliginosa MF-IS2 TaxID=1400762 RepID=A0A9P6C186_9AGAR|nr:hypothetical protein P691DRAFT_777780 [Macrolepiota fuliginosa MF-IS2]